MTKKIISINPDAFLVEAVELLLKHNFNGLPVIDVGGKLVGIITEYDLIIKGSTIHLPTFIKLLQQFEIYKKDKANVSEDIKKILKMTVRDAMNLEPLTIPESAPLEEATKLFSEHHRVNPLLVVDNSGLLVGILSRYDIIKLLGIGPARMHNVANERELDKSVNQFLSGFEKQFVLVSKFRTHYWFIASILFAIVGFFIAFAIILRIE